MVKGSTVLVSVPDDEVSYPVARERRGQVGKIIDFKTWDTYDGPIKTAQVVFVDGKTAWIELHYLVLDPQSVETSR